MPHRYSTGCPLSSSPWHNFSLQGYQLMQTSLLQMHSALCSEVSLQRFNTFKKPDWSCDANSSLSRSSRVEFSVSKKSTKMLLVHLRHRNSLFSCSPKPLFQSEAKCEAIDMKNINDFLFLLRINFFFTKKVLHFASYWKPVFSIKKPFILLV